RPHRTDPIPHSLQAYPMLKAHRTRQLNQISIYLGTRVVACSSKLPSQNQCISYQVSDYAYYKTLYFHQTTPSNHPSLRNTAISAGAPLRSDASRIGPKHVSK